ncbi:MAG: hypothetical protein V3W11_07490 [bacterium]
MKRAVKISGLVALGGLLTAASATMAPVNAQPRNTVTRGVWTVAVNAYERAGTVYAEVYVEGPSGEEIDLIIWSTFMGITGDVTTTHREENSVPLTEEGIYRLAEPIELYQTSAFDGGGSVEVTVKCWTGDDVIVVTDTWP